MAKPQTFRNGIKLRDGRPRWEPSPANRNAGIGGHDVKGLDGRWIADRGKVVSIGDLRSKWATTYRTALRTDARGAEARKVLAEILPKLPAPKDDDARLMRNSIADILEKCRALLEQRPEGEIVRSNGRTVADLVKLYFDNPPPDLAANTISLYRKQTRRLVAKFGNRLVGEIERKDMRQWYLDLRTETTESTAFSVLATAGAMFKYAMWESWRADNPASQLGMSKPQGRLVFIPFPLEEAFVRFCDRNGFEDVADAVTLGCWTAASQIDGCKASIDDLSAPTWRYIRQKTHRRGGEAIAGILPAVSARVERRRSACRNDGVDYIRPGVAPFLFNPNTGEAHTSRTIGEEFQRARGAAMKAWKGGLDDGLEGIGDIQLRDTRDTCVTRLFMAGVPIDRIPPWTGHSRDAAEVILRQHYIVLLEEGALETATQLQDYADRQGFRVENKG